MSQCGQVQLRGFLCNIECSLGGVCAGEVPQTERGDEFPLGHPTSGQLHRFSYVKRNAQGSGIRT